MQDKSWTLVDHTTLPPVTGLEREPDKVQWTDPDTLLPCLALRNLQHWAGNWCGYVAVGRAHPWFGKDYSDLPDYGPDVHGGLTYADKGHSNGMGIKLDLEEGDDTDLWFFGFDCAHADDLVPGMIKINEEFNQRHPELAFVSHRMKDHYWTLDEVQAECTQLARQLAEVKP